MLNFIFRVMTFFNRFWEEPDQSSNIDETSNQTIVETCIIYCYDFITIALLLKLV